MIGKDTPEDELVDRWKERLYKTRKDPDRYARALDFFRGYSDVPLIDRGTKELDEYFNHISNDIGKADKTITTEYSGIKDFYNFLEIKDIDGVDLVNLDLIDLDKYKSPNSQGIVKRDNIVSDEEFKKLRAATKNKRNLLIISILFYTGVRNDELAELKLKHLSLDRLNLHVAEGKFDKSRDVPYHKDLVGLTKMYLRGRDILDKVGSGEDYIIPSGHGGRLEDIGGIVVEIAERSGIQEIVGERCDGAKMSRVTPHLFRHTFATRAYKRGMDVDRIMRIMGHESLETTWGYIHVEDEEAHQGYHDKF